MGVTTMSVEQQVEGIVAAWPLLSDEQRERLGSLLHADSDSKGTGS